VPRLQAVIRLRVSPVVVVRVAVLVLALQRCNRLG
jgi:hypothetical protein